jgi:hypothetical protein
MRSDFAPGGTFPDYELPDHTNVLRKLSELQGEDPMILTLASAHYCPNATSALPAHRPNTRSARSRVSCAEPTYIEYGPGNPATPCRFSFCR